MLSNSFLLGDPMGVVAALLAIEGLILVLSDGSRLQKIFRYLPSMFWIYFLPMLGNSFGLFPMEKDAAGAVITPVYAIITDYCLPASLVLLLISVDLRAIARLGPTALGVMLAGSLGVMIGGPISLLIFRHWLPADIWMGFGALSASWIGGSANMLAVARGTGTPDSVYLPMVVVDTVVPYTWMGLLIFLSAFQKSYDRWNGSRTGLVDELIRRSADARQSRPVTLATLGAMLALAGVTTYISVRLGAALPVVPRMLSASAWTIILASTIGVGLSFTPLRRLEEYGASRLGYFLLYLVLASLGAKANLSHLAAAPLLIVAGFVWILIHGATLILAGRLLRAPMSLLASASQANIGGPASAPVVAGVYQAGLAPVGLLMAVLGNIVGTYLGFATSWICGAISRM